MIHKVFDRIVNRLSFEADFLFPRWDLLVSPGNPALLSAVISGTFRLRLVEGKYDMFGPVCSGSSLCQWQMKVLFGILY